MKLTARDVRLIVDQLRADGVGNRVIQHAQATLRADLEHAYRGIVPRNVAKLVRTEHPQPKNREPLTADEAVRICSRPSRRTGTPA